MSRLHERSNGLLLGYVLEQAEVRGMGREQGRDVEGGAGTNP